MRAHTDNTTQEQNSLEGAFEIRSLFEFSAVVNASLDLKFILSHFLLTLMGKLLSLRGIILLQTDQHSYRIENVKGLPRELIGVTTKIDNIPKRIFASDSGESKKYHWLKHFKVHGINLFIPLVAQDKIVGIAGFAPGILKNKLSKKESTYIRSLSNIAAAAIEKNLMITELKQVNRKLDGKVQELNTLFEVSKEFNTVLDSDRLLKLLMFSIMGQIGVNRFAICLEKEGTMGVVVSRLNMEFKHELCSYIPSLTVPVLVKDITRKSDAIWKDTFNELGIHGLIPLRLQNQTKGLLAVGEKMRGGEYTQNDLEFLFSLGNSAIIALENARLFKEAIEKQRMEDDLLIAKDIQKGLLPTKLPDIPRFDVAATNISSKQVGGDYYDFIQMSNGHYAIAIGDVSGKGTPASLLMANLQATIRALVQFDLPLSELTKRVNNLICDNTSSGRFITFFWGMLDTDCRKFKYVNAGHNPPFLIHPDGTVKKLDKGGIILGIMKTVIPYQEDEITLEDGDVLVLYTDGVSEAMNLESEEFSEELLEKIIKNNLNESPSVILNKVVDAVREHSKGTTQSDDITLVVVKANSKT